MRVAFLLQDLQLSGGVGVVVEHVAQLRRHHAVDAQLVLTRPSDRPPWGYRGLTGIPVLSLAEARAAARWDIVVASWWETALALFSLDARRHAYFVQLLEDSAYPPEAPERVTAAMTTALPVRFITEARWIAEILEDYQRGTEVLYVRNGIAKEVFAVPASITPAVDGEALRVVVEGSRNAVQKGVNDALAAVAVMDEPAHITWVSPRPVDVPPPGVDCVLSGLSHAGMADLFASSHVLLKLARAEGMYGPPLEAFHMGATVVTTPVTGHDEYIRHGENGVVVGWDDPQGTARALDVLARDRRLLHELRCGALSTARAWPDWRQSSQLMALALRRILTDPMPSVAGAGRRLASDIASTMAEVERSDSLAARHQRRRDALLRRRAWRYVSALRDGMARARRTGRRLRGQPADR